MGRDTDGTEWRTVRYIVDVDVIADNDEDALYYSECALKIGESMGTWSEGKVLD